MTQTDIDLRLYNPMDRVVQQNPFPFYSALRAESPVHQLPGTQLYCISRMSTVYDVLSKPQVFSSRAANAATLPDAELMDRLKAILSDGHPNVDTMLTQDPPLQTRYRKTVGKAFSTRRILDLEPRIREIADELIDGWPNEGDIDFMTQFAVPFPVRVIASMLSMEPEREADIKRWSDDSVAALGVKISDERRLEAARGLVELQQYWAAKFKESRRAPKDDLISDLAAVEFEDETGAKRPLDFPEMISIVQQLMVAGNETTTKLLNETLKLLIENPAEWEQLRKDPSLIPNAVEEALRLSTPNQGMFRQVLEDVELEGVKVPKGSTLWVIFGSANRDESVFPDPDRFDPSRDNLKEHVAFGRGAHFCIGAPLARLEVRVCLEQLATRIDALEFAPGNRFEYEPSFILRGLSKLDLRVRRAS